MNRTLRTFVIRLHSVSGRSRARVRTKWLAAELPRNESLMRAKRKDAAVWGPCMTVSTFGISQRADDDESTCSRTRSPAWTPQQGRATCRGEDLEGLRAKLPREAARFWSPLESQTVRHRQLPLELLSYRRFNRIETTLRHTLLPRCHSSVPPVPLTNQFGHNVVNTAQLHRRGNLHSRRWHFGSYSKCRKR